jgi:hypothetical protein
LRVVLHEPFELPVEVFFLSWGRNSGIDDSTELVLAEVGVNVISTLS